MLTARLDTPISRTADTGAFQARPEPVASTSKIPLADVDSKTACSVLSRQDKAILRHVRRLDRRLRATYFQAESVELLSNRFLLPIENLLCRFEDAERIHPAIVQKRLPGLLQSLQSLYYRVSSRRTPPTQFGEQITRLHQVILQTLRPDSSEPVSKQRGALHDALKRHVDAPGHDAENAIFEVLRNIGFRSLPVELDIQSLKTLTDISLVSSSLLGEIGKRVRQEPPILASSGQYQNVSHLNESLFLSTRNVGKAAGLRMYGPSAEKQDLHAGLSFLLSCWALNRNRHQPSSGSDRADDILITGMQIHATYGTKLLNRLKSEHLPCDRQAIAAALAILRRVGRRERIALQDYLPKMWQEWTLLRENDVAQDADATVLNGFLHAIPRYSHETWIRQALDMATAIADIRPLLNNAVPTFSPGEIGDYSRLIQATALAATRTGNVKLALDCLFDGRLAPEQSLDILWSLANHLAYLPSGKRNLALPLAKLLSDFTHSLVPAIHVPAGQPLSARLGQALVGSAIALFQFQEPKGAKRLLSIITERNTLAVPLLSNVFQSLLRHDHSRTALAWYSALDREQQTNLSLATPLLGSPRPFLSDRVWTTLQSAGIEITPTLFRARMQHHVGHNAQRYQQALEEYQKYGTAAGDEVEISLLVELLKLHVVAKKPGVALETYRAVMTRPEPPPPGLHNIVLPVMDRPLRRAWRTNGPVTTLSRTLSGLDSLIREDGHQPDAVTANILLLSSLKWGALSREDIWTALNAALHKSSARNWHKELKPLYRMVIKAFRKRGDKADARDVVVMMSQERNRRRDARIARREGVEQADEVDSV